LYESKNANGEYPSELPSSILAGWKERSRAINYSPYPQTLFYCDKVYYSVADPNQPVYFQGHKLSVVRKLPFPLICDKDYVEIAQAMDPDNDGFPEVWIIQRSPGQDRGYIDPKHAADDSKNKLDEKLFDPKTGKRIRIE
jgi:hypothetical protein